MQLSRNNTLQTVLATALSCALCGCAAGAGDTQPTTDDLHGRQARVSASAYHDQWRQLMEDHVTWTRVVILGVLSDLPGTPDYTARLLQNVDDMGAALAPYYDAADVAKLGDLLRDHLVIAAAILTAARAGDTATMNAKIAEWRTNADDITAQMAAMNPDFWPADENGAMWQQHLDATLNEATSLATGNFAAEIQAYDEIHVLALDMADMFSTGIIQQSPRAFRDRECAVTNGDRHGHDDHHDHHRP
jgi:hypothetical protein